MKFIIFSVAFSLCFFCGVCQKSPYSSISSSLICPGAEVPVPIFPLPCHSNEECIIMGPRRICCSNRCVKGILPPSSENKPNLPKVVETTVKNKEDKKSVNSGVESVASNFLVCPGADTPFPLFPLPCKNNQECSIMGPKMMCCTNRCIRGISSATDRIEQNSVTVITTTDGKIHENVIRIDNNKNSSTTNPPTGNIATENLAQNDIFVCPGQEVRIPFFSYPCSSNKDCLSAGDKMVCCSSRCIKGILLPKPEIKHAPSWFGLVERNCPTNAITEILDVRECRTDADCSPRICCAEKYPNGTKAITSYCRTPQPSFDRFPAANRIVEPFRLIAGYLQCTPPPPPLLDIFPKSCKNALDCFPNLCCQEGGKKYCRPPRRSLLSFVAGVGQRFVPSDAARRLLERLN